MEEKELRNKLKYFAKKRKSISEICNELGIKDYEIIGTVMKMKDDGELIDYVNGEIIYLKKPLQNNDVYEIGNQSEQIKLLLISDTHLCSKYDRLDILRYLYGKAEDKEVKYILHSGDFTDGKSARPEHVYELKELSYEGQVDYCVEKYPHFSGRTFVISGNHDDWWYKSTGSEIVKTIASRRDDITYLGPDIADLKIGGLRARLFHGSGGRAYSKSYKIQKHLEVIPSSEKPHILQTGHTHDCFYMLQDGTHCFQTGCLEDLTPYARSLGFPGEKSCWWVTVDMDDRGKVQNITPELELFGNKKLVRKK